MSTTAALAAAAWPAYRAGVFDPTTGALTLFDLSGDNLFEYHQYSGRKLIITDGTASVPVTSAVYGPTVKMARTESFSAAPSGNNVDIESNATLAVYSTGLTASVQQNVAVVGIALNSTTAASADAVGGYFVGQVTGSGTNDATGLFASGRRDSILAMVKGAELNITDLQGANEAPNTAGQSRAIGLWVSYKGTAGFATGTGVGIGAFASAGQFDSGFQVVAGAAKNYAYRDDSSAVSSYGITGGTHTYGYDANLGTYTTSIMRLNGIVSTGADGQSAVQMNPDMRLSGARTTIYGLLNIPIVDSSDGTSGGTMNNVTSFVNGNFARVDTSNVYTGTVTSIAAFHAGNTSKGNAGATVTNQYGFYCDDLTIGVTQKAAFFSNVNATAGAAAFYAAGSAISVFTGALYAQGGVNANAGSTTGLSITSTQTPGASNADSTALAGIVATGTTSFTTHINSHIKAATKTGTGVITNDIGLAIDMPTIGTNNYSVISNGLNGENYVEGWLTEQLTLSTSTTFTDTAANLLPANSIILAVETRITTAIATATNWSVGDATTAARFNSANSTLAQGTVQSGINHTDGGVAAGAGQKQAAAAKVRITTTGTPSAGVVRISVNYRQYAAPTS